MTMFAMTFTRRNSQLGVYVAFVILAVLVRWSATMSLNERHPSDAEGAQTNSDKDVATKEFSMQAWLLFDPRTNRWPSQDTSQILRRITPKSVFIAPVLPACAEGYQEDTMHRCMKNTVAINTTFHLPFLLKRLEQMYSKRNGDNGGTPAALSSADKQSSGPLQLNIPLVSAYETPQASKEEEHEATGGSMEVPVVVPPDDEILDEESNKHDQVLQITVYEVKNDTNAVPDAEEKRDEKVDEEYQFFPGNTSAQHSEQDDHVLAGKPDTVDQIADFIDEGNETKVFEAVGYETRDKTSVSLDSPLPTLQTLLQDETVLPNVTDALPTVFLLLSNQTESTSTKLPNLIPVTETDDLRVAHNRTTAQLIIRISNVTAGLTDKGIIDANASDSVASPSGEDTDAPYGNLENENNTSIPYLRYSSNNDTKKASDAYEDFEASDYTEGTDVPEEESIEGDGEEILKHGEAGMTIPVDKIDQIMDRQREAQEKQQEEHKRKKNETKETELPNDKVIIRFNDTTSTEKDEADGNVSSEVSINGDFIMETTLLNVNTEGLQNYTTITSSNNTMVEEEEEEEKDDGENQRDDDEVMSSSQPEVIPSSQNTGGTVSTSLHSQKRTEHIKPVVVYSDDHRVLDAGIQTDSYTDSENGFTDPEGEKKHSGIEPKPEDSEDNDQKDSEFMTDDPEAAKSSELMTASSSSEAFLYDLHPRDRRPPEEDPITEIHTIDEQESINSESIAPLEDKKNTSSDKSMGSGTLIDNFKPSLVSFKPIKDYVTFSSYGNRPSSSYASSPSNYVKFPVDEANSILSKNYKDHLQYPPSDYHTSTSTKSSVAVPKPSYWWVPQSWRTDRQQQQAQQFHTASNNQRQKNRPTLLRFWTRMPLLRDPSFFPSEETSQPDAYGTPNNRYLPIPGRRFNFYKEVSPQDVNRIFAQNLRSPIGG